MALDIQLGPVKFTANGGAHGLGYLEGWPVTGSINSPFGEREVTQAMRDAGVRSNFHTGIDIALPSGTPIYAPSDGWVRIANNMDDGTGFILRVAEGDWEWEMYHLREPARIYSTGRDLAPGDRVIRGWKVGEVGSTGVSTGPHLHFGLFYAPAREYRNPATRFVLKVVSEALTFPPLSRQRLAEALVDTSKLAIYTRKASQIIAGGETYEITVQRGLNGEVV